jgi:hypothetical protein
MSQMSRKVLLLLDCVVEETETGAVASFSHPDLHGSLALAGGSLNLLEVQVDHLDLTENKNKDPFNSLLDSANKLAAGITEFREVMKS